MGPSKSKKQFGNSRTDCKAQMRAKLTEDGQYTVVKHIMEHNHQLTRKEIGHYHRSRRAIKKGKTAAIIDMTQSGIGPADSFRYLAYTARGEEQVGHTKLDHMNFVNRQKIKAIEGGDTKTFMDLIQKSEDEDSQFFYKVQMDDDGRMLNVFWRDSMMLEDFQIYGDVMIFDTTYRTNKYDLICAPFIGINNHWKNTMFACAFLSDEKIESFEKLFTQFKKSMGGRSPVTIFTDQYLAIANAIKEIIPGTRYSLCLWHLAQNAVSRFAELKSNDTFKQMFNHCLTGCKDSDEFDSCWNQMITTYKLKNHHWFNRLYTMKDKWSTDLSRDFFSAGLLSSQRSESTNYAISYNAKRTTRLTDFFNIFTRVVKGWRENEKIDDFKCLQITPDSTLCINGLVKHTSEVYTLRLYKLFEEAFLKGLSATFVVLHVQDTTWHYKVKYDDTEHMMSFEIKMKLVLWTCKKFEECGVLCCHSLRILLTHSVQSIPSLYIKKRWTKNTKAEVWARHKDKTKDWDTHDPIPWRHEMARKYYNLILEAEGSIETQKILEEGYERDMITMREMKSDQEALPSTSETSTIKDPKRSKTKRRNKRPKNHFERKNKRTTTEIAKKFGSKTPNPRLF